MTLPADKSKDAHSVRSRLLGLAREYHYQPVRGGRGTLEGPHGRIALPAMPLAVERVLGSAPTPLWRVLDLLDSSPDGLACLTLLARSGIIEEHIVDESGTTVATGFRPCILADPAAANESTVLPDDLIVRPAKEQWTILCPRVPTVIRIAGTCAAEELAACIAADCVTDLTPIGQLLWRSGMLVSRPRETGWEMHDAYFHAVTASGNATLASYGKRSRRLVSSQSAPNFDRTAGIELESAQMAPADRLVDVLQRRRSRRRYSKQPVDLGTLGLLLQTALRTQRRVPGQDGNDLAFHAYGSAGARDELLTIVARRDEDGAALYAYDNYAHRLHDCGLAPANVANVIDTVAAAAQIPPNGAPSALIFAASYERMAAAYQSIAYANILRNVGGVYQTVALIAEALGLACCATGGGWSNLERGEVSQVLDRRVIVGAVVLGWPATAQ